MKALSRNWRHDKKVTAAILAGGAVAIWYALSPETALAAWTDMDQLGREAKTSWENWGLTLGVAIPTVGGLLLTPKFPTTGLSVSGISLGVGGILASLP